MATRQKIEVYMKRKNILLYAGAAVGVTVCGVFLSKELREMLFDALAHPRKDKGASNKRDQIKIDQAHADEDDKG